MDAKDLQDYINRIQNEMASEANRDAKFAESLGETSVSEAILAVTVELHRIVILLNDIKGELGKLRPR